jgi:hypothetical protein
MRKVTVAAVIVRVTMATMTMAHLGAVRVKMLLLSRMTRTARSEKAPKGARIEQWLLIKMAAVAAVVAVVAMVAAAPVAVMTAVVVEALVVPVAAADSPAVRSFVASPPRV